MHCRCSERVLKSIFEFISWMFDWYYITGNMLDTAKCQSAYTLKFFSDDTNMSIALMKNYSRPMGLQEWLRILVHNFILMLESSQVALGDHKICQMIYSKEFLTLSFVAI